MQIPQTHEQIEGVGSEEFSSFNNQLTVEDNTGPRAAYVDKKRLFYLVGAAILFGLIVWSSNSLFSSSEWYHAKDKASNDIHRTQQLTFNYPTLGIPTPGKKYNSTKVAQKDLATFDQQFLKIMKPYNDTDCQFGRYGDMNASYGGEGGYLVCKNFINQSNAMINVGINGFDAFGCEITTVGHFANEQYDCINPQETPCPTNNGMNHMHKTCLAAITEDRKDLHFETFEDVLKTNHLQDKKVFLKIDCEGCEYPGLKYVPIEQLDHIDQLVGQFHFTPIFDEEWGMLDIFRSLTEKFVVVNLHMTNFACTDSPFRKLKALAVEYTMVNKKLLTKHSETQSFALHQLSKPSVYQLKDCQMI